MQGEVEGCCAERRCIGYVGVEILELLMMIDETSDCPCDCYCSGSSPDSAPMKIGHAGQQVEPRD